MQLAQDDTVGSGRGGGGRTSDVFLLAHLKCMGCCMKKSVVEPVFTIHTGMEVHTVQA